MKKILLIVTMAAFFVACNRSPQSEVKGVVMFVDTTGLAQFQDWKAQHERLDPNQYYNPNVATSTVRTSTTSRNSSSSDPAKTVAKKGWSKAAKGTAIGGATGAVLGAVINKRNRVAGAVIGAILGGGTGFVIGRSKDKKDGRY
ncbi:MAG TPA: glycine zipper domain-containing protein [Chitinophagaceae bacterium]|nr:glycine zipper domain-containing protein [Chitinophagaceae bacterium]